MFPTMPRPAPTLYTIEGGFDRAAIMRAAWADVHSHIEFHRTVAEMTKKSSTCASRLHRHSKTHGRSPKASGSQPNAAFNTRTLAGKSENPYIKRRLATLLNGEVPEQKDWLDDIEEDVEASIQMAAE